MNSRKSPYPRSYVAGLLMYKQGDSWSDVHKRLMIPTRTLWPSWVGPTDRGSEQKRANFSFTEF